MHPPTKILIVGGGFGGVYSLKNLHKIFCNDSGVSISLIAEKNYFLFTPLLHEVATGSINPENIVEPIRKVLGCCLDSFHLGRADKISLERRTVETAGKEISYDYLILAPGAQTNFYGIPGAEKYSFALKSLQDAIKIKNQCIRQMELALHIKDRAERKKKLAFVIVGGGSTGVEMTAELEEFIKETFSHYYPAEVIEDVSVTLIQKGPELMPQFGQKLRDKSLNVLQKKGVSVLLNTEVKEVSPSQISLSHGKNIDTETVIWVAGIKPADLQFEKTIPRSASGQIIVNEYLQLTDHREVFVIGDVAFAKSMSGNTPLPALAQVATKQAAAVAKNIKLLIKNRELKPFTYRSSGTLISLGQWMAAGQIFNFTFSGHIAWFIWRTVYLFKLISWEKKVKVAIDWTTNLFLPRDISEF